MDNTSTTHRNSRQSAPYGHACTGCARAKCRCINGLDGRCERCRRLDKECVPSPTVRRQQSRPSPGSGVSELREAREVWDGGNGGRRAGRTNAGLPSRHTTTSSHGSSNHSHDRTTQLEQKLDNLVNLLTTQAQAQQGPAQGSGTSSASPSTLSTQASGTSHAPLCPSSGNTPASLLRCATASSPLDEDHLRQFRNVHLQSCPFIYIPPEITVDELRQTRPFLWLNIRSVCCKSSHEVVAIDNEIRAILAQRVIIDLERSMDLLQGLLVFLIWTTRKFKDKPFLSVYSGIATSMVCDLRLDRFMLETINRETNSSNAFAQPLRRPLPNLQRTNEERRAVLGCYILSAGLSMFLRTPAMRWTHHMEECLQHLIDHPEVPGDTDLTIIVRIDRILADVVTAGSWRWDLENPKQSELPSPMLYVKSLRANMKAIVEESPQEVLNNKFIRSHIAHAEILINDLPLFPIFAPKSGGRMDVDRVSCLHRCLEAMRRYFDIWLSLTAEELFCSPSFLGIAYSRAVHILYRLSCVDDPSWEKSMVRETIDVVDALEKGAGRFASIPEALGLTTSDDDVFNRTAPMLRACKVLWQKNIEESANNSNVKNKSAASNVMEAAATAQTSAMNGDFQTLVPPQQQSQLIQDDFTFMDYVSDNWQADPSLGWLFTSANTAPFFS